MAQIEPTGGGMSPEELARLEAMQRAIGVAAHGASERADLLPPVRISADSTASGGEDPNHLSTNVEPTTIGGLNPTNAYHATNPATAGNGALYRAATAGGPPPGFTGTFNGTAYSGGQPAAASSGSMGAAPAAPPTATMGGSLGGTLTPPRPAPVQTAAAPTAAPTTQTTATPTSPFERAIVGSVREPAPGPLENQNPNAPAPGGQGAPSQGATDLQNLTGSIMSEIQSIQSSLANPGTPIDATAVYLRQSQSILAMLDEQEKQLRAENEKNGTTIDPATQFTIDRLRQTLDENLKTTRENLNSRGLYDSGIELELENRLQKGSASDQAQILAERLSRLQDQLSTGLASLRSQRVSTASQFGLAGANAQTSQNELSQKLGSDREQAALQAMLGLRGQVNTAETARLGEVGATQRSSASDSAAMQRALASEQGANSRSAASLAQNAQQFGSLSAYQQAQIDQANQDRAAAQSRAASAARAPANTYTVGSTNYQSNATQTQNALDAIYNNYDLLDPAQNQAAQQAVIQNAQAILNAGVDPAALLESMRSRNIGRGSR